MINELKLGEIATFRNGLNFSKETRGSGCLLVGIPDFKNRSTPKYDSLGEINPQGVAKAEDYLKKGDILFVRSNGNKKLVGRTLYIDKEVNALYSGFCIRARLKSKVISPLFLSYFTKTNHFKSMISSSGGTSIQNLNQTILGNVNIPLFSESMQYRITKVLSDLDAKIELNNTINTKLEDMAKLIYDYWFVQFDFPTSTEYAASLDNPELKGKPYKSSGGKMIYNEELKRDIPEGWEVKRLCDLITIISGNISPHEIDPKTPYIGLEHIPRKTIVLSEWESAEKVNSDKCQFRKHDILFGKIRPYFHKVGIAFVDGITSTDTIVMRSKKREYLGLTLQTVFTDKFVATATLSSTGTKMPRANWKVLKDYLIPMKEGQILNDYQSMVDKVLSKIELNVRENREISKLRDWLLPMLMNGQVRVGEKGESS